MPSATTQDITLAIERAAASLPANPAGARADAEGILKTVPGDPRALLILGSALRRLGDAKAANAILEPLASAFPRAANTQYELGATAAALGDVVAAATALRQAVGLNREFAMAWRLLGDLLFAGGDAASADAAYAEHARAIVRDPVLRPAADAIFHGDLERAERLLRQHILSRADDVVGLRMLGDVFVRIGRYGDAEVLLARCLELDATQDGARFSYATALFRQQKSSAALPAISRLLTNEPANPAYRNLMAACLTLVGEDERASTIYEGLVRDYPGHARAWVNFGHSLKTIGRPKDAEIAYRRCLSISPTSSDAYWGLANLKLHPLTDADEAAMRAAIAQTSLPNIDHINLRYALGKACEDRGDFPGSFEHYSEGARRHREGSAYDANDTANYVSRCKSLLNAGFFADRSGSGWPSEVPIFIIGLPRAGSTLVEQILASHSAVEGTMELPDLGHIARSIGNSSENPEGTSYPERLGQLDRPALHALGIRYLKDTAVHRKLVRPHFIDKMPNNFQHVGLIQLILPKARVIDVRRHPLGSCFSAFKQHFAQGQAFSYDLEDLGHYYRNYVDLLRHFDTALPGRVHRVIYEDLVEDPEREIHRLLAYCNLPFEHGCLAFHTNDRAVRTPSSEQVRRPIFRDGLEQWRHYEPWFDPLKRALGPALEQWRT